MKTILVLLFIICSMSVFAQNESGERPKLQYYNVKSDFKFYNCSYPIIRQIPPIYRNTPKEIVDSYKFFDSVLKGLFNLPLNNFKTYKNKLILSENDTVRKAWKYLYLLDDYDPIISQQYNIETIIDSGVTYKNSFNRIRREITEAAFDLPIDKKVKVYSLLEAQYVLKVVITKTEETPTGQGEIRGRRNFTSEILDTLKGNPRDFKLIRKTENNQLSFLSSKVMSKQCLYGGEYLYKNSEPNFSVNYSDYIVLNPKDTIIVFLSFSDYSFEVTKKFDRLSLTINFKASNGALPVINGMVKDINKVWSDELYLPYEEWKEEFEKSKRFILDFEL